MSEPQERESVVDPGGDDAVTLTDEEIETRPLAPASRAAFDDADTGDDTGDPGDADDAGDDTGDSGDDGDDTGDDAGDDSDSDA